MINLDEDSLICDLAEVYHIYNMRELSPFQVATFSCGLRDTARIRQKMAGIDYDINSLLLATCADHLQFLAWCQTENAAKNINKPKSLLSIFMGQEESPDNLSFATAEDFENCRRAMVERIRNHVNDSVSICADTSID